MDLFEYKIEDLNFDGMTAISLVDFPAVEKDFILLNKQLFSKIELNEEKNIITGVALIPNKKIFRFDYFNDEHYVFFSEETVKQISEKFIMENKKDNVTIDHLFNANDIKMVESWVVEDPKNDKSNALGFLDLPKGTWMVSYKVENLDILNQIKDGTLRGFSIEAFVTSKLFQENIEDDKLVDIIKEILFNKDIDDDIKYFKINELIKEN